MPWNDGPVSNRYISLVTQKQTEKKLGDMLRVQSRMVTVYKPNRDSDKNLSGKEGTSLYSS